MPGVCIRTSSSRSKGKTFSIGAMPNSAPRRTAASCSALYSPKWRGCAEMMTSAVVRKALRVLLVEDCDEDAQLLLHELRRADYDVVHERVQTADEMKAALARGPWAVG